MAVQALVISHLEYSNSILVSLPDVDIIRLQRVQNFAAKVVLGIGRRESSRSALFQLRRLPVRRRIHFKIVTLVYKVLNGQGPMHLADLLTPFPPSRYSLRNRSRTEMRLLVPKCTKRTFAERSFVVQGPKLWNLVSDRIKISKSVDIFKQNI